MCEYYLSGGVFSSTRTCSSGLSDAFTAGAASAPPTRNSGPSPLPRILRDAPKPDTCSAAHRSRAGCAACRFHKECDPWERAARPFPASRRVESFSSIRIYQLFSIQFLYRMPFENALLEANSTSLYYRTRHRRLAIVRNSQPPAIGHVNVDCRRRRMVVNGGFLVGKVVHSNSHQGF